VFASPPEIEPGIDHPPDQIAMLEASVTNHCGGETRSDWRLRGRFASETDRAIKYDALTGLPSSVMPD